MDIHTNNSKTYLQMFKPRGKGEEKRLNLTTANVVY